MKRKHIYGAIIALCLVPLVVIPISISLQTSKPEPTVVCFPPYRGQKAMDAVRDMITDLGWKHKSEGGTRKGVAFEAVDQKGRLVKFDFTLQVLGSKLAVSTEPESEYSAEDVTKEVARRLGARRDGPALPKAKQF